MIPFENSIALIGAGQMGQALARGFCNSGECDPDSPVIAYDPSLAAEKNSSKFNSRRATNKNRCLKQHGPLATSSSQ